MHVNVEYPEAILNIKDIKASIDAGDKVGDVLERALFELDNDICIRSSEESGITHREKILGINPRDTDSIEDRRLEVLLRWYDSPLYTETVLRQKMDATLGENQYVLNIDLNTKTVFYTPDSAGNHTFQNTAKVAEKWAVAARVKITANDSTGEIALRAIGMGVL